MKEITAGARFRELHEQADIFVMPNPWDTGTARILAALGFPALATTSAGFAFSLGRRDACGAVSRDEALEHASTIVLATELPVSADLENGYADAPDAVAATVRLAAETGLAGCSIEDATGLENDPIYPHELAVERIAAAAQAARGLHRDFLLTARAENFLYGRADIEDTIKRLQAFEAAGADVLYAPGLRELDTIAQVCAAVSKPVNAVMGLPGTQFTVAQLAEVGVRRISLGSALSRAALGAFLRAAREVADAGTFGFAADAATFSDLDPFMQ